MKMSVRVLLLAISALAAQLPPVPAPPTAPRMVDGPSGGVVADAGTDILANYKGAAVMPLTSPGCSTDCFKPSGYTMRVYPDGKPYILAHTANNHLVQVALPALRCNNARPCSGAAGAYLAASVVSDYGDVWQGRVTDYCGTQNGVTLSSIAWVESLQALYWNFRYGYLVSRDDCLTIGASTLDDTAHTGAPVGVWRLAAQSPKTVQSGVTVVPADYAARYLNGWRVALGSGGMQFSSINNTSMGPSLTAVPDLSAFPDRSAVPSSTPLVGYWPYQADPGGQANRPPLPPLPFQKERAGPWENPDGYGGTWPLSLWQFDDEVQAGMAWLSGAKRGVLYLTRHAFGLSSYDNATVRSEAWQWRLGVYDPEDFAPASGQARQAVVPSSSAEWKVPDFRTDLWPHVPVSYPMTATTTYQCPPGSGPGLCNPAGQGLQLATSTTMEKVPVSPGYQTSSIQGYVVRGAQPQDYNGMLSYSDQASTPGVMQRGTRTQQQQTYSAPAATVPGTWSPAGLTQTFEMRGMWEYAGDVYIVMARLEPCCAWRTTVYVFGTGA